MGNEKLYAPVTESTGRAMTSIFGVPIACIARIVALGIVVLPVVVTLPDAVRKVLAGGSIGAVDALTTVLLDAETGTPVITAVARPLAVITRS